MPTPSVGQTNPPASVAQTSTAQQRELEEAKQLNQQAFQLYNQGNYTEAEPLYQRSLAIREKVLGPEHPDVALSLNNLAGLYFSQGNYTEAEPLYQRSLAIRQKVLGPEHQLVATSLNNLAALYQVQGKYTEAEPLYQRSLAIREKVLGPEHPDVAQSLNNLAGLYRAQGKYTEAEPLYQRSLAIYEKVLGPEHPSVATSLNNLAGLYESQGKYTEAEPLYQRSLAIREKVLGPEHQLVATSLNNLAALYRAQGKYTEAEPLYQRSLAIREKVLGPEHPSVATSLNNLALLYESQGKYTEAEPLYQRSLAILEKVLGPEHQLVATSLNNLAALYRAQGKYTEAEPLYQRSLAIREKVLGPEHQLVATSLNNLSVLHWSQGNITNALSYFQQAIAVEEYNLNYNLPAGSESQKQAYLKTLSGSSHALISFHLKTAPNNPEAAALAFTTIAQRKGRLLDFLSNSQQILRRNLDPKSQQILDDLNAAKSQIAHLFHYRPSEIPPGYHQQMRELNQQIKTLEDQLSRHSSLYRTATKPITLDTIQQLLPADTVLVEFVRYRPYNPKDSSWDKPRYAVYILHPQGSPVGIDLGTAAKIEPILELLKLSLQDRKTSLKQVQDIARQADQILMQPVRQHLGNTRNLLIAPDHELNTIPFAALVDENNQYLLKKYQITYLTSSRDLVRMVEDYDSKTPPLLLGNPNFAQAVASHSPNSERTIRWSDISKWGFSPIPETETEVKAIGQLLGVNPLIREQATEAVVKQANSPLVLHIATHGFFQNSNDNQNPLLLSGLVLAGFQDQEQYRNRSIEDGILTALEVTGINLVGTQLVVLSACDTRKGKLSTGDGIYGLRRALVIAGTESQVISLWRVGDDPTKKLMIAYYQKLKQGQGRSEALRQTQLAILERNLVEMSQEFNQHPYYWAGFIPSGNWLPMRWEK
ncbi:MAG: tetratricopeptide repeat protein [Xenococcaceae cyanobacterium]